MSTESVNKTGWRAKWCIKVALTFLVIGYLCTFFTTTRLASNLIFDFYQSNAIQCKDIEFGNKLTKLHLRVIDTSENAYIPSRYAFKDFWEQYIDFSKVYLFAGDERKGLIGVETPFDNPGHKFQMAEDPYRGLEDEIILKFDSIESPEKINTFKLQFLKFPEVRVQPMTVNVESPAWIMTPSKLLLMASIILWVISFFQTHLTARERLKKDVKTGMKYGLESLRETLDKSNSPIKLAPFPKAAPEKKTKDESKYEKYRSKRRKDVEAKMFEKLELATEEDILSYKTFDYLNRRIESDPDLDDQQKQELLQNLERRHQQRANDAVPSIFEDV